MIHVVKILQVFIFTNLLLYYATAEILGMAGEDRRPSAVLSVSPFIKVTDTTLTPTSTVTSSTDRTPSPTEDPIPWKAPHSPKPSRHKTISETQYADTEVEELLAMLRETESLEEQGDILQYLVSKQGDVLQYLVSIRDLFL